MTTWDGMPLITNCGMTAWDGLPLRPDFRNDSTGGDASDAKLWNTNLGWVATDMMPKSGDDNTGLDAVDA
eukprot:6433747-Amphidinium_carterae.1